MPFLTTYDPYRRLVVVTPDGDCDFFDGVTMLRGLAAAPLRPGCAGVLADLRCVTYLASQAEVQAFAEHIAGLGALPFAVVAAGGMHLGVANQLAGYAGLRGARVGAFTEPGAAAAWLAAGGPAR